MRSSESLTANSLESFARTAEAVAATTKKLEKAALLEGYFRQLDDEDLARAARYFAGYRGGDGRTWLLTVVRRAAYDWLAERRAWPAAAADEEALGPADESFDPALLAARRADRALLRRALDGLPTEFREAIVLREFEGLSYQQIAAVAAVPVGTVMSRLSRARRQLQRQLARCPGGED